MTMMKEIALRYIASIVIHLLLNVVVTMFFLLAFHSMDGAFLSSCLLIASNVVFWELEIL